MKSSISNILTIFNSKTRIATIFLYQIKYCLITFSLISVYILYVTSLNTVHAAEKKTNAKDLIVSPSIYTQTDRFNSCRKQSKNQKNNQFEIGQTDDPDLDGISTLIELTIFETNPNMNDTDNDGLDDGLDFDPLDPDVKYETLAAPLSDNLTRHCENEYIYEGIKEYCEEGKHVGYIVDASQPIKQIMEFASQYQYNNSDSTKNKNATLLEKPFFFIKPGEYFEGVVDCGIPCNTFNSINSISGRYDAPLTIQPLIPNTVTIRGSLYINDFIKANSIYDDDIFDDVYYIDNPEFDELPPLYVWETDTLYPYESVNSINELLGINGSFYYEKNIENSSSRLYIRTSDGFSPENIDEPGIPHKIEITYYDAGISFHNTRNIIIKGLSFKGYHRKAIMLENNEHTLITDCTIQMCAGNGIVIRSPGTINENTSVYDIPAQNHVNNCEIFAFYDRRINQEGAGIMYFNPQRDSSVENCIVHTGNKNAIRFYNRQPFINTTIKNNIIDGNLDMDFKAVPFGNGTIDQHDKNITYMDSNIMTGKASGTIRAGRYLFNLVFQDSNISTLPPDLADNHVLDLSTNCIYTKDEYSNIFADPIHKDYRLQQYSQFRNILANNSISPYTYFTFEGQQIKDFNDNRDIGPYQFNKQDPVLFVDVSNCNIFNNGLSENNALCSIQDAINIAENDYTQEVTIYVKEGSYNENIIMKSNITLCAHGDDIVIINGALNAHSTGIIINEQHKITIQDIVVKNFNKGIEISNSSNIKIYGNQLLSNSNTGILINSSSEHIQIMNNTILKSQTGISILDEINFLSLLNNIFYENQCHVIISKTSILNNLIHFDYNGYFSQVLIAKINNDKSFSDLDSWQSYSKFDINSMSKYPYLISVDSGGYEIHYTSPYIRAGINSKNIGHNKVQKFDIQDINENGIKDIIENDDFFTKKDQYPISNIQIYDIGTQSASIRWESKYGNSTAMLFIGEADNFDSTNFLITTGQKCIGRLPNIHLNGLKPDTQYMFAVGGDIYISRQTASNRITLNYKYMIDDIEVTEVPNRVFSKIYSFKTLHEQESSNDTSKRSKLNRHIYFVDNSNGDDSNNGLSKDFPWKTIFKATQTALAGDIVFVKPGLPYHEALRPLHQGTTDAPIKFISSDPKRPVILDGRRNFDDLTITSSVLNLLSFPLYLATCHNIHIEGFHFRNMKHTFNGTAFIHRVNNILIKKCIFDGMRSGSNIGINLSDSSNTKVEDCIFINHWSDVVIYSETAHNRIDELTSVNYNGIFNAHNENIVFNNSIFAVSNQTDIAAIDLYLMGSNPYIRLQGDEIIEWENKVTFTKNIFTSPIYQKADGKHSIFYALVNDDSTNMNLEKNCLWFQKYDDHRTIARILLNGSTNFYRANIDKSNYSDWLQNYDSNSILLNDYLDDDSSPYSNYGIQTANLENKVDLYTYIDVDYHTFALKKDVIEYYDISKELFYNDKYALVGLDLYDEDNDGIGSRTEMELGLNPDSHDSDNDGISDWYEHITGLNPLNPEDALLDLDGDSLSNYQEYILNADDLDNDGFYETFIGGGPHPMNYDSDGDGISDLNEKYKTKNIPIIQDIISVLKIITKFEADEIVNIDVNNDNKVGIEEAIYILKKEIK